MMTRRTAVGAGLAVAAVACAARLGAYEAAARRGQTRSIDVLLIDETIEMPRQMAAFIEASRQRLPVLGIQLDAAAHAGLMRVLNSSRAIVGISSGATLFCLERLAWDHGFRLRGRSQWCASEPGDQAFGQDMAALLSGASAAPLATCAYRPSRADATLHAWVMHKSARPPVLQDRREV
jgi:hypothetical protein